VRAASVSDGVQAAVSATAAAASCLSLLSVDAGATLMAEYLRELVLTDNEDGLEDLPSEDLGLDERDGLAVEADETLALLAVGDGGGRLLLAEARYGRSGHDD